MFSFDFLGDERRLLYLQLCKNNISPIFIVGMGGRNLNFVNCYSTYYIEVVRGWTRSYWATNFSGRGFYFSSEVKSVFKLNNCHYWRLKFMRNLGELTYNNIILSNLTSESFNIRNVIDYILRIFGSWNNYYNSYLNFIFQENVQFLKYLFIGSIQDQENLKILQTAIWEPNLIKYWGTEIYQVYTLLEGWSAGWVFVSIILFMFFFKNFINLANYTQFFQSNWAYFINLYIYSWIFMGENKVESIEEVVSLIILWPWCIFLIFSHLITFYQEMNAVGFAEWGLPVLYGFILLAEHQWSLGSYSLVYLVGIRSRKSLIINIFEDIGGSSIMVARVGLQAVRGVIVGMFHFICREALLVVEQWWNTDNWFNHNLGNGTRKSGIYRDILNLIRDLILAGGSLVIITAIMFLQLLFLLVSVWLFCKCWYISWGIGEILINIKKKFYTLFIHNY